MRTALMISIASALILGSLLTASPSPGQPLPAAATRPSSLPRQDEAARAMKVVLPQAAAGTFHA